MENSEQSSVELTISCQYHPILHSHRNLIRLDYLSQSDPQVIVYHKEMNKSKQFGDWKEIGRTEYIMDQPNPKFTKSFTLPFKFEQKQHLKFLVIDIDKPGSRNLSDHDEIGTMECTLGEIAGSRGQSLCRPLQYSRDPKRKNGLINVRIEEYSTNTPDTWFFTFSVSKLEKKNFLGFGKSDPYLIFSKMNRDNTWTAVHTTEVYKDCLAAKFKEFQINSLKLCNNDIHRPIKIECWDWNSILSHSLIGMCTVTLGELQKSGNWDLKNPASLKKSTYLNSGILTLEKARFVKEWSFLDYLSGGLEISLVVAIDFTGSNGKPHEKTSLHYREKGFMNDYQKAILSVGEILNYYDSDHKYPVYGFGAFINGLKKTSHCFPCNMNDNDPEVVGVDGILDVYDYFLDQIQLSGPTNFSEVINRATSFAKGAQDNHYYVLLILTDGEITDMDKTVDEIIFASDYPLSIIIVGIGNDQFSNMHILDGDDVRLASGRNVARRDIVQFVPFRDYKKQDISALADEVLKELPDQVCEFMKMHKYQPKKKVQQESFFGMQELKEPPTAPRETD